MARCIGNSIFYRKCTKLIVFLIRVSKPKTTFIMKQREYLGTGLNTKGISCEPHDPAHHCCWKKKHPQTALDIAKT